MIKMKCFIINLNNNPKVKKNFKLFNKLQQTMILEKCY